MTEAGAELRNIMRQVYQHEITPEAGEMKASRLMLRFKREKTQSLNETILGLENTVWIQNRLIDAMARRTPRWFERLFGRVCMVNLDTVKVG